MPKTKLTPKQLFERRNTTDVFNREVLVGLLRVLNRKLIYEQIWNEKNDEIENVTVPFFYDFSGGNQTSERFIQDNYMHFTDDECTEIGLKKIDGNFDFYPQGRIGLSSVQISSGDITNRFSMATHTKIVDGQLKSFASYLYSIPLQFQFNVEIRCETMNTAFKIDQAIREFFYKNKTYHFNYRGTICPVRVGFPESALQPTAGANYQMGNSPQDNYIKLTLSLQCETYQPVFDQFSERPAENTIKNLGANVWVNSQKGEHKTGMIEWLTDFENMKLMSGQEIMMEWKYNYADRDLLQVDIFYQEEGSDEEYLIDSVDNHNFYHWYIPEDFVTGYNIIDVIIPNNDKCIVSTQPQIYLYPDTVTHIVDSDNVYVKNKGFFIVPRPDCKVDCKLSYLDKNDEIKEFDAKLNLNNFMIDTINPIEFECFVFDNDIQTRKIRFIVKDHFKKENKSVSDWVTIF